VLNFLETMYTVYKFGGASIRDVENIKNVGEILLSYTEGSLIIIFSAMGKVTNMLEDVVEVYIERSSDPFVYLQKVKDFHYEIINNLFHKNHIIFDEINNLFVEIEWVLESEPSSNYSYNYDQIVSVGEFLSTKIMSAYLEKVKFKNKWLDARDLIRTDNTFRDAKIDWEVSISCIKNQIKSKHYITQGFIGCTSENFTTTLGREGSDFTAAILAFALDADKVVIWKDVPGMMNADPKHFADAELIEQISFDEAIELAFYGAKVIHPKTIQPLKKKQIPLHIKSFMFPLMKGSEINEGIIKKPEMSSLIVKDKQILISISDTSLAFIVEMHISMIFSLLAKYQIAVNLMQNSAISFSICVDNDKYKVPALLNDLKESFDVRYNDALSLYTLRHYTDINTSKLLKGKKIILEQKSRNTLQIVVQH